MNTSAANADTLLRRACTRGSGVQAGVLATQSVNVLRVVRFPPSRLRLPVSRRVYAFSRRTVMNNPGCETA